MFDHGEDGSSLIVGAASGAPAVIEDASLTIVGGISNSSVGQQPRPGSFINAPPPPAGIVQALEGIFVECDEETYNQGIQYGVGDLDDTFPSLSVVVKDARVYMRSAINVETGTGQSLSALASVATQYISGLMVMATVFGCPVERGKYYRVHDSATNPWQQESRS